VQDQAHGLPQEASQTPNRRSTISTTAILLDLRSWTWAVGKLRRWNQLKTVQLRSCLIFHGPHIDISLNLSMGRLLDIARGDMRPITGSNLRRNMLLSGRSSVQDLKNVDLPYHWVPADEAWRIGFVRELVNNECGDITGPGLLPTELDYIINYMCTD
jgi:hypothetical protein